MRRHSQGGAVLVLFALFSLGLLGLASLVIDFGFVKITSTLMQEATDGAALESLRTDSRAAARDHVFEVFSDRSHSGDGSPETQEIQYGAGPYSGDFEDDPGIGDGNASQTIDPDDLGLYRPGLQLNESNAPSGDIVFGRFQASGAPGEDADYAREDFIPDAGAARDAVLVRLRRLSSDDRRPGLDQVDGVSSSGPALPLLLGRGAAVGGGDPSEGFSIRHHGISVRATSIARAQGAVAIGGPTGGAIPGGAPFAWTLEAFVAPRPTELIFGSDGELMSGGTRVGVLIDERLLGGVRQVGQPLQGLRRATLAALPGTRLGYAGIFASDLDEPRLVGFAAVRWQALEDRLVVESIDDLVAPENASANPRFLATLPDGLRTSVLEHFESVTSSGGLKAPALVR
ncbi:MAG: pilus assembly protein TadG-related protein [Planctomycetota bacterium]